jgi:hypothetical protein
MIDPDRLKPSGITCAALRSAVTQSANLMVLFSSSKRLPRSNTEAQLRFSLDAHLFCVIIEALLPCPCSIKDANKTR